MKKNRAMRMAAALLCLTLLSCYLLSGMLAKYQSGGRSTDTARAAGFGTLSLVETTGEGYVLLPGVNIKKDPTVTMTESEVAVHLTVELTLGDAWKQDETDKNAFTAADGFLSWRVAEGWAFGEKKDSTYIFARELAPGQTLEEAEVIEENTIHVSPDISYEDYYTIKAADLAIGVEAEARQID